MLESGQEVSQWVIQQIRFNISNWKNIGLATGQTMVPIYEEWVKDYINAPYDLKHHHWYLLDELLGYSEKHPDTYQTFLEKRLLNPLSVKTSQCHFPTFNVSAQKSADLYEHELNQGLDFQLLGIGGNGHVGLNEPGTDPKLGTHVTEIAQKTRDHHLKFAQDKSISPSQALTQGISTIQKHKNLFLIATGENKAMVMKTFFETNNDINFPASLLKDHTSITVIMDKAAAAFVN